MTPVRFQTPEEDDPVGMTQTEILSLKGDSYRLKDRDIGRVAPVENQATRPGPRASGTP